MNTKDKLQELKKKVNNPKLSLLEIARLLNELLETSSTLQDKNQKEERKLAGEVGEAISTAIFKHIDRLEGETEPPEAELRFLAQWGSKLKEIEANWTHYEKQINAIDIFDDEEKQRIIKQWKRDIENFKKYEPKLEKMFQKYNEQQQKNSAPSEEDETTENSSEEKSSESKEIKQLETKIQLLENQIEGWKATSNSADQAAQAEIKQKIESLEKQKGDFQTQLNKLKEEVSSTTSTTGRRRDEKSKGFPTWGIILLILGILAVVCVAGYFFLQKREEAKAKKPGK